LPAATLGLLAASLVAEAVPGLSVVLEYDRNEVLAGAVWRSLTGQVVHWSWGMALADLGVILLTGGWLETRRSRCLAVATAAGAAILVALVLLAARPDIERYRGASGVAVGLVAAAAFDLHRTAPSKAGRLAGAAALGLLLAKIAAELATGASVLPGTLPVEIDLVPETHLAGAAAGAAAVIALRHRDGRGDGRRRAHGPPSP
jgi:rhomboid family GlyGly-CTERM serine protease